MEREGISLGIDDRRKLLEFPGEVIGFKVIEDRHLVAEDGDGITGLHGRGHGRAG